MAAWKTLGVSEYLAGGVLVIAMLGPAGCTRHTVPTPSTPRPEPDSVRGKASFTIIPDPGPAPELPKDREFVRPQAIGQLATPVYPEAALAAKFGRTSVVVRIVIGTEGAVTEIGESPNGVPTAGLYAREFRAAVEDAVHKWKFEPAALRQFEDGADLNGDGKPDFKRLVWSQVVPVYIDVRFDFEIVNGKGQVKLPSQGIAQK